MDVRSASAERTSVEYLLRSIPTVSLGQIRIPLSFEYTKYFEDEVLRKRPYLRKEWCEFVVLNAEHSEPQELNRLRFWARVPELDDRYLRVITLSDGRTIHNAFPDRGFKP